MHDALTPASGEGEAAASPPGWWGGPSEASSTAQLAMVALSNAGPAPAWTSLL